jgi:hypothetical protein
MCSGVGDWACPQSGFPIRKSSDLSSVANSPRLIAGSYVLHRLLVPRHPPCALTNLTTKIYWMLASTMQFSSYGRDRDPFSDAYSSNDERFNRKVGPLGRESTSQATERRLPVPSGPNSVPGRPDYSQKVPSARVRRTDLRRSERPTSRCSTLEQPLQIVRLNCGSGCLTAPGAP